MGGVLQRGEHQWEWEWEGGGVGVGVGVGVGGEGRACGVWCLPCPLHVAIPPPVRVTPAVTRMARVQSPVVTRGRGSFDNTRG